MTTALSSASHPASSPTAPSGSVACLGTPRDLPAPAGDVGSVAAVVLGYASPGDGGAGLFIWLPDSTIAVDGGLTILPQGHAPGTPGRWQRVAQGAVSVKWFGAIGDGRSHALSEYFATLDAAQAVYPFVTDLSDQIDWAAIQAALNTGRDVSLPRGSYLVRQTLRFHDAQKILGEASGTQGILTEVRMLADAAVFRSAAWPALTRNVLIADLAINNVRAVQPSPHVPEPRRASEHPGVDGVPPDSDGDPIGIDFTGVSYSSIERCSLRGHVAGIVGQDSGIIGGAPKAGGQYVSVHDCELAGCYYGAWLWVGNAWHIYDGRILANRYGIWCTHTVGSRLLSTFESNGLGVVFADGAGGNSVSHSYFEGNGRPDMWSQLPPDRRGAVRFDDNTNGNSEANNVFSNSEDTVINNGRGVNVSQTARTVAVPTAPTGFGAGQNLLINGDFASWRALDNRPQPNQLATGWMLDPPFPAHEQQRLMFDPAQKVVGTGSQRWQMQMSDAGLSQRAIRYVVPVTPGQWYAFSGWTRVSGAPERFSLRIGNTLADHDYYYSGRLSVLDTWQFHRQAFRATTSAAVIYVQSESPTGSGDFWMDAFKLEAGQLSTGFDAPNLFSEGLRTLGPPLAAADEIVPTHTVHRVTGTATIRTISLPSAIPGEPSVAPGELILIPADTWQLAPGGNIAVALQARPSVPVRCIFDPTVQKWFAA